MKKGIKYSKESRKEKERKMVLDNFYTKQMKNGKTTRADSLDRASLGIFVSVIIVFLLKKLIGNFMIALLIGMMLIVVINRQLKKVSIRKRLEKIEDIKRDYKIKLEEEKVLSADEDVEDYIIERYYEKKSEYKASMNFFSKDKIFKLYLLFIIFFIGSYFATYPIYYKLMAVTAFIAATFVGSYNLTEFIRKKDNKGLLR